MFFVNFWLNQIHNCCGQIKKMKDGILSFQLKKNYSCRTLTHDARHTNVLRRPVSSSFSFLSVLGDYGF